MSVFEDLHVRGLYVTAKGGPLYMTQDELDAVKAREAEMPGIVPPLEALGYDVQVDDAKAATQAKAAEKAYVPPAEPDPPGVTL